MAFILITLTSYEPQQDCWQLQKKCLIPKHTAALTCGHMHSTLNNNSKAYYLAVPSHFHYWWMWILLLLLSSKCCYSSELKLSILGVQWHLTVLFVFPWGHMEWKAFKFTCNPHVFFGEVSAWSLAWFSAGLFSCSILRLLILCGKVSPVKSAHRLMKAHFMWWPYKDFSSLWIQSGYNHVGVDHLGFILTGIHSLGSMNLDISSPSQSWEVL